MFYLHAEKNGLLSNNKTWFEKEQSKSIVQRITESIWTCFLAAKITL